jgi:hypothetical protein
VKSGHGYDLTGTRFGWWVEVWCSAYGDYSDDLELIAVSVGPGRYVLGSEARAVKRAQRILAKHMRWEHDNVRRSVEVP